MATYEINVSLNGNHFFATHERSLQSLESANHLFELFAVKFPVSEGYKVSMTVWQKSGQTLQTTENAE